MITKRRDTVKKHFHKSDCVEMYCVLSLAGKTRLMRKVGIDGEKLAAGKVKLTPNDMNTIYWALHAKRDRLLEGAYDKTPGEVSTPKSVTNRWARHLGSIMATLFKLASGDGILHVKTSLHMIVCPKCRPSAA